jgi:hypothetical protein
METARGRPFLFSVSRKRNAQEKKKKKKKKKKPHVEAPKGETPLSFMLLLDYAIKLLKKRHVIISAEG